jgi:8-oxo-dGTP pyrophosphatase MutT (NUDIX family)
MKIERAGIIPFIKMGDNIEFMFMKPSDPKFGGNDWQIAKGHIDGEEDALTAALREGHEELGLREDNIKSIKYIGEHLGSTKLFICEVYDKNAFDQFHYETGDIIWLTKDSFIEVGRDIHKKIIEMAYDAVMDYI